MRRLPCLPALVASALILGGCGTTGGQGDVDDARLALDFTPNAVHAGIYTALARDFDSSEGVRLRVRPPSESTDAVRLLAGGRVEFAILDINDLAVAREAGRDVVGVMALVQRPLAAVFAQPAIRRPRDLEGRRVGVSGLPSDVAVLESVVRGDGGDPRRVRRTSIGFTAVAALLGRRVDGVTAFWNAEGVALRGARRGVREFRVDRFGAPAYPELVLCTTSRLLQDDPGLVKGLVAALRRGYDETLKDPESAVETIVRRNRGLEREAVLRELRAVSPAFTSGASQFGELDRERLLSWATWAQRFGVVRRQPDVDAAFVTRYANG